MQLNEYQQAAMETAIYRERGQGLPYTVLGLAGEAGELCNKLKKHLRDGTPQADAMVAELGDVLWYAAAVASELGVSLDFVVELNLEKLRQRSDEGTLRDVGRKE